MKNNENKFKCDKCHYNSGSKTLVKRHMKTVHKESTIESPTTGKKSLNEDVPKIDETPAFRQGSIPTDKAVESQNKTSEVLKKTPTKKHYSHKRRKCEQCEKQFNKKETYEAHMKKDHKGAINVNSQEGQNESLGYNNMTLQKMFTRQMANKNKVSSGDHHN